VQIDRQTLTAEAEEAEIAAFVNRHRQRATKRFKSGGSAESLS
jgi:hypothetical protein